MPLLHYFSFTNTAKSHAMSMKALIFQGPGKIALKTIPKPKLLTAKDAIVKVSKTTICGTDLHIIKGHVPESIPANRQTKNTVLQEKGLILGHEGIGKVVEVGDQVSKFKINDKVIISCTTSCGECYYCKKNLQSLCNDGGWILGHNIDGTQADYVRIPYADHSLHKVPENVSEESLLMLSDMLPTGNEVGSLKGKIEKGDTVAIVGSGPIGIAVLLTSQIFEPSAIIMIDVDDERLRVAKEKFGATHTINPTTENVQEKINEITSVFAKGEKAGKKPGVDVAIECVGSETTFQTCQDIITPGGRIANVGLHGGPASLALDRLFYENVGITTGVVCGFSTQQLLKNIVNKKLSPEDLVTHRFKFDEIEKAYEVYANAGKNKAIKTFISNDL